MTTTTRDVSLHDAFQRQKDAVRRLPPVGYAERCRDLDQIATFITDQRLALIEAIHLDYGQRASRETDMLELGPVLDGVHHAKRNLARWMKPQSRHIDRLTYGLASNRVLPQPLGVVGVIVPWNLPVNLSFSPLVNVFAAGNRALVKMSEHSPNLSRLLCERIPEYFAEDKLRFFGDDGSVGPTFSGLPFDHLLFTGSAATGRKVMAAAALNLTPVTLELGGKSPAVIADDFDIALAAERILQVKCLNAGQICVSVDHVWCPEPAVDHFVVQAARLVRAWYGSLDSPDYSSIIHQQAYQRLCGYLDEASAQGAKVIPLLDGCARNDAQHRLAPHVVLDLPDNSALLREEIFGPILPVRAYQDWESVIHALRSAPSPLALYPFSHKANRVQDLIDRVPSGGVAVNDALLQVGQDDLPFGGQGESGFGHYHGHDGFMTFSKMRPIFRQGRWSTLRLLQAPYGLWTDRLLAFLRYRRR